MAQINIEKIIVTYRNRFLREVLFDLVVKFGKESISHILDSIEIESSDFGKENIIKIIREETWVEVDSSRVHGIEEAAEKILQSIEAAEHRVHGTGANVPPTDLFAGDSGSETARP